MWYRRAKSLFSQNTDPYSEPLSAEKDPWWRTGYLSHGHSWTSADPDPHDDRKSKLPPPNVNDALWVFVDGKLSVVTAGEWHQKGNRGFTFVHDDAFGDWASGSQSVLKGRYDAAKNIVSIVKNSLSMRGNPLMMRALERKFPRARIVEF